MNKYFCRAPLERYFFVLKIWGQQIPCRQAKTLLKTSLQTVEIATTFIRIIQVLIFDMFSEKGPCFNVVELL